MLFADIKGSTQLIADLDPEQVSTLFDPVLKAMMDAVHAHDGTVNKVQGDGVMALFGAPLALEDHAVRACNAAIDMQAAAKEISGDNVEIRVGLHSGEVVVRSIGNDLSMDYDAIGPTVHLAGRMEQMAEPGSVLITADTFRLAEGFVETRPLGKTDVRGLADPVELFELMGITTARGRWDVLSARGLTRFSGREEEMASLNRALARAGRGEGQIVAVVGEAGMGKSRLAHEFVRSASANDWAVRTTAGLPHGRNTAYLSIAGLLRALFDVADSDTQNEIYEKMHENIAALDKSLLPIVPALQSVLDLPIEDAEWQKLDPPARRTRIIDAIKGLALRRSQSRPVLLVFEDLHWIDAATQAVLDSLADAIGAARIMLLVTYRPEYTHEWSTKSYYSRVRIDPLGDDQSNQLLDALLGNHPGLEATKRMLVEKTAGRPLFQEEMVRNLAETGILTGDRGNYRLTGNIDAVEVPASVQAVLAARIDRLPPEQKDILHVSSVVGRTVSVPVLQALTEQVEESLNAILAQLQVAEFLYETRGLPSIEYTFKHALTHDIAYGSVLLERRKSLHARLVETIERLYHARLEEHVEQLADHAVRGELWQKAAEYCRQAGSKAIHRSAHADAIVFLNQLVDVLGRLPQNRKIIEQTIDVHLDLRAAYGATGDVGKMGEHVKRATTLADSIGDRTRGAWARIFSSSVLEIRGKLKEFIPEIERAQEAARSGEDGDLLRMTDFVVCAGYLHRGDFARALDTLAPNIAAYYGAQRHERFGMTGTWSILCLAMSTMAHLQLGHFSEAKACAEEALKVAEETDRPFDLGIANWALGSAYLQEGLIGESISTLKCGIKICQNTGTNILVPMLAGPLSYAYALLKKRDEAAAMAEDAWDQLRNTNVFWLYVWLYAPLALAFREIGNYQSALEVANFAQRIAKDIGIKGMEAEMHRVLGFLNSDSDLNDKNRAAKHFQQAFSISKALKMLPETAHCQYAIALAGIEEPDVSVTYLTDATEGFRSLGMAYWQRRAEEKFAK